MAREIEQQQRVQKSVPFGRQDENGAPAQQAEKQEAAGSENRPQAKPKSGMSWLKKQRRPSMGNVNKENAAAAPVASIPSKVAGGALTDSVEQRSQAKLERKAALARLKERRV